LCENVSSLFFLFIFRNVQLCLAYPEFCGRLGQMV